MNSEIKNKKEIIKSTLIDEEIRNDTRLLLSLFVIFQGLVALLTPVNLWGFALSKVFGLIISLPGPIITYWIMYRSKRKTFKGAFYLYYLKYFNVWWYILIIGMVVNNLNNNYQVIRILDNINDVGFNYIADMFKIFMISILAFLAANIINQMLEIRDGYETMKRMSKDFISDLNDSKRIVKDLIRLNSIAAPISNLMLEVQETTKSITLTKQVDKFVRNFSEYTNTLAKFNNLKDLRIWNFSLFNKYIESNREYLEKNSTIFIPYTDLKAVVTKFMKYALEDEYYQNLPDDEKPKFYALFAASPIDFFPKLDNTGTKIINEKEAAYCKWNFHIKQDPTIDPKIPKGINIMERVFVCVNCDNNNFEFTELKHEKVCLEVLKKSADDILKILISDANQHLVNLKEHLGYSNAITVDLQKKYINDLKKIQSQFSDKIITVKDLLKEFHSTGCAKLLEVDSTLFESLLVVKDGSSDKKLKDFFAIKRFDRKAVTKDNYIWSYCLATDYNTKSEANMITIYHEYMKDSDTKKGKSWNEICSELDKIFLNEKQLKEL